MNKAEEQVVKAAKQVDLGALDQGWTVEKGVFYPFKKTNADMANIPPAIYDIGYDMKRGPFFVEKKVVTDRLVLVEGSATENVLREVEAFVARRGEFIKRGFLHKRGILLAGGPGSGKTSTIQMVARSIVEAMDGLVIFAQRPGYALRALSVLRATEAERLMLCVLEDIDAMIEDEDDEVLLSLLDGDNQVDNVIYLATTNYPEKLPPRIWDRPSRFDSIIVCEMPNEMLASEFLRDKEPSYTDREIEQIVRLTKGFSLAHLKEFIVLNKCFGHSIENAAKRMTAIRENKLFKKGATNAA